LTTTRRTAGALDRHGQRQIEHVCHLLESQDDLLAPQAAFGPSSIGSRFSA
jgi:hypothetical protein